ncbi:MAG: hypothetical protein IKM74_04170 [Bacteroidales bacterium]|nr:hypothetical protein [Bacteroidales bacterium]
MKKLHIITVSMLLATAFTSCVVSSSKYEALQAERDSLANVAATVTTDFESSLRTINEIEMALQTVREAEGIMMMENQEGNSSYAEAQIEAIDRTIQQNKAKIAELEQQLAAAGSKSKELNTTINRLKNELNEKDTYINNLREELNISKAQVAELSESVEILNANIDNLNVQNAKQQATISQQDAALNTVYYIAATAEKLAANHMINQGGLFTPDQVTGNIDMSMMTVADKRDLKVLPLNSRKAKILTNHPESSYQLTKDDDKNLSLVIVDPNAFWSISNYLIISIK